MSEVVIDGKDLGKLHSLIANAHCHLIKKSYLYKADRDTLKFSKDLQSKINEIRREQDGKLE